MKKPIVLYSLACDYVITDKDGKMSLLGVFENINAPKFPVTHPFFFLVSQFSKAVGEYVLQIKLMDNEKKNVLAKTPEMKIKFERENRKHNVFFNLVNTQFESPGTYWIESFVDGISVYSEPLNLVLIQGPELIAS